MKNILDTHFARAIRKYGKDNFCIELIDTAQDQEELNCKEYYWIKYYNSTDSNIGYNETDAIYKCGGNTYQYKTEDEMQNIKQKIRNTKLGSKNPNAKSIKCCNVETNEELIFETAHECKRFFKEKNHRFITTRTSGKTKCLYKGKWNIAYLEDNYIDNRPVKANKTGIKLKAINLNTLEQYYFESIRLASRIINISRSKIEKFIKNNITEFEIDNFKISILD